LNSAANGRRLTPLRNSSPPQKREVIAPGAGPLGRIRLIVIIVTTNLKLHFGVHSLSLGQSLLPHVLSGGRLQLRVGPP